MEEPTVDPVCRRPIPSALESLKPGQRRTPIHSRSLTHEEVEFSPWMVLIGKKSGGGEGWDPNMKEQNRKKAQRKREKRGWRELLWLYVGSSYFFRQHE